MTYRLDLPDGTYYEVPDDMPREVAEQKVRAKHPELYLPKQETFGGALMKGGKRLVSDVQTLAETPFVGKNEAARRALERSQALEEEYGTGADFSRVKQAYGKSGEGILPAAGELLKQSGLAMTEMVPYLAEMGIASKLGAKAGSPLTGLGIGAYVPRVSQNIEEQAAAQQEAGKPIDVDLEKAAGYAIPRAGLDIASSVLPLGRNLAGKLFGDDVAKMLEFGATKDAEVAARSILGAAARGVGVNLAEQVPIQVAQAALGRAQLGKPLLNDEAFKEYGHAGYVAGIMSPLGALGGIGERSAAKARLGAEPEATPEEAAAELTAKPEQTLALPAPPAPEPLLALPDNSNRFMLRAPENFQEELFAPEQTYSNKPFSIKDLSDEQLADIYGAKQPSEEVTPTPYSGQGWLPGMEPSWQHQFDEQAEAEQRAASEGIAAKDAEQLKLITEINALPANKWVTPAFVAKTLGVDIAQAKETMKTLEGDGYIANPNKAGWYKPTEKVAADAPAIRRARMMGGFNVGEEEQRRARLMGGKNLTLDEQRRAPMMGARNVTSEPTRGSTPRIGGRNLLLEEEQNVSGIKSDVERDVGEVSSEGPVAGRPATSTEQLVQQRGIGESGTTEPRTDRLVSDRTPIDESDEGKGRGESTLDTLKQAGMSLSNLSAEDRSRVLRMPYVEARQKMLEANEPNVRWQMAADKLERERAARRAAVKNETQRLGSMARREAPTKSERAVESLRNGNLGEALYHLMNEAGGHIEGGKHPYPHGEASPLRYLARALFNTIHRGDIGEREKIVDAEIARRAQEVGETQNRTLTDKERRDIRNRIMNDHKLTKVDVLDVDGRLTAAGRIIYKAGKNGKPIVDKEGNLVRNFTPDSERLVPLTGKAKLNTYSGDFESLGGGKIFKSAFAGAEVAVEKPRMNSEDKAVIDRLKKEGKLAEYDPKQNKFYFTEAGLNDRTILHEMVHAATVKVLKQYADPTSRKSLSETQRIGAQELNKIYEIAKKQLGEEHADALENIYEFASHAATDKKFQQALSEIPAGMLGTVTRRAQPSLWNMFTRALARMFGLDHTQGKTTGNALLNASQAIHDILSTPEKGIDVPPLAERAPSGTGTARANESAEKINKAQEEGNDKELLKNIGKAPLEYYDGGSPDFLEKARRAISNMPSSLRDGVNSFLSIDHLYQIYKKEVPAIREVDDALNGRQASLLNRKQGIRTNLVNFDKLVKEHKYTPAQMNNLYDIAIQSTRNQIELLDRPEIKDKDGNITQRARKHVEGALYDRYKALPEPMKKMYETLRNEYDRMSDEYVAKLVNGLNATEAQKLRASYEAARLGVYLPLYRRGQYWLSFKDKNGEIVQRAFRSVREREQAAERIRKSGGTEVKSYERLRDMRNTIPPTAGFLNDVLEAMKKQGIKDANVYDAVYEAYLDYLPAQSIRQRFREREGTLGMERDIIQTYANVATTMETMLNNLDYAPKLDKAMENLRVQAADHLEKPGVVAAVRNIEAQVEFARNPKISNAINKLGFFNYTWYLAGNASSAIVNLTHLPMVVYPLLWGKHGTGPTEAAFANAFKAFKYKGEGKDVVPKGYEKLYEEALRTGALHEHMGQEIYDLRETSVNDYTGLNKRVFEKLNYMFTVTDRMNREATLMAAYDLALGKMKTTKERATAEQHEAATREAIELVNQSYGTATLAAGPRILQNSFARIMLTFKRFALNRMFILGRVFKESFWGESPEVKSIARKQLLGIYATAFAFGGIAGLPVYGAATMLANMLMGDDDHPVDVDELVRTSTNDLAYRGPINKLLNLAVSHRVGWNDMFWTDDPKRLAEVGVFTFILERSLGPAYSQLLQLGDAADHFANGRFERGFELITPVAARNVMKGIRFGLQDATTKTGEKISDVNVYNALMQAIGFAPADLSETQAKSSAGLELENKITARRSALLDQWWGAYSSGDTDAMQEVQDRIDRYNDKNPSYPITESTKSSSVKLREKRALDAVNGINFNPKLKQSIMEEIGIEDNSSS
mgnify:CR=1 FL=1